MALAMVDLPEPSQPSNATQIGRDLFIFVRPPQIAGRP